MFRRILGLLLFICLICASVFASDTLNITRPSQKSAFALPSTKLKRSFSTLLADDDIATLANRAFFLEQYATSVTSDQEEIRGKIEATYDKVFKENRFIDFLDLTSMIEFPVGIKTDLGVLQYTILVDSIVMTPAESFLYASMVFQTPQGKRIHFIGSDIKFSRTGGLSGDGKLLLVGDYPIKLDGENSKLIIKGSENKTFVEFDCKGYKQMSLDASLLFSRNLLLPEGADGKILPEGNVALNFTTTIQDWDDIMVTINVPKFQVNGLKDVSFQVSDAVLDFSDTRNIPAVKFPDGYSQISPELRDGNANLWQGVYLRELTVTLPPQFEKKDDPSQTSTKANRITFKGNDLIIDHVGFSGKVSGNNLIPIEKGKIGNWNFSLESIYVKVVANELVEGGFNGKVNIPINKNESADTAQPAQNTTNQTQAKSSLFTYAAVIKKGNEYLFTVSNPGQLNFDLWKANVTITPASYVEIKLSDGKFLPKAHLNGEMTMNLGLKNGDASDDKSKNVKVAKVKFEGLEIQTIKPYVKVGAFSLGVEGGDSGCGGFPIHINEISGSSSGNTITLGVDLTLSLIGEKDGGFAANGKFNIVAESVENGSNLSYKFKEINFERFGIDIDKGSFKFKGTLNIYKEDPVYGNGISGTVDATFNPGIRLAASAIFGTKDGMRYWYVDAMAEFKSGITVFTGFAFYGFGGGAYYHMKIDDKGVGSALGKTVSGMVYVPDESVYFGLKATVAMGVQPGQKAFNGDATFEMAFNKGGGLKYINFRGNGYFMSVPVPAGVDKLKSKAGKLAAVTKKMGNANLNEGNNTAAEEVNGTAAEAGDRAQIWASLMINYDFDNHILHGNLSAYINVAGGVIKGGGPNGRAGEAVLHFAPGEWYIYIGRPEYENRFAIEVLGIARLDAYFVIGTTIPGSPPPPDNVKEILGGMDLDYMKDLNALGDGAGVGFGASFKVDTGDKTFLMFYGRFQAGLGFDIMLKDYGDATCKGGGKLGVNGWYANGQAYAFFEGNIGIRVKIFGRKKKIPILEIAAAVVAQAMLPNPTWVRGVAGGKFRVLGGLVKGNCKFEIEIGKKCEIVQNNDTSPLESVEVLAELTPNDGGQKIDVFTVPQAVFNYEMNKAYEMVDDVTGQVLKFKINLDEFSVKDGGNPVKADLKWNDDKTVAALNPFEILPSEKELSVNVVTSFQEDKGGIWQVAMSDGAPLKDTRTAKFTTDKAPDHIPPGNVAYSYPITNQFNYYKNEATAGYITLKQGQSDLFKPSNEWSQVVRFSSASGEKIDMPLTYNSGLKEIQFTLTRNLTNEKLYQMSVVNVPKTTLKKIDTNVDTVNTMVASSDADNNVGLRTREAEGTIKDLQEKSLYNSYFRTSRYNSLAEKMAGCNPSDPGWRLPIQANVHMIGVNLNQMGEPFSSEELIGANSVQPIVQLEADLGSVPWYNNEVYPLVYDGYPLLGSLTYSRDPAKYGKIPTRAIVIDQYPYDYTITQPHIDNGTVTFDPPIAGHIDYYLPYFMYLDFDDLRNAAAAYVYNTKTTPSRLSGLLTVTFPYVKGGNYWVNVKYVLPGKNTVSSTSRLKITNPLN